MRPTNHGLREIDANLLAGELTKVQDVLVRLRDGLTLPPPCEVM